MRARCSFLPACSRSFGHDNVAGHGEALCAERKRLSTCRAHNEQAMAHAAIVFAKVNMRRRIMACTTSIRPGTTDLVTVAPVAHVNCLPVLLLPGDIFGSRLPDPALQEVEDFADTTFSANDCLRPVSRNLDRILRPEQLWASPPAAMQHTNFPRFPTGWWSKPNRALPLFIP